MSLYDKAAVAFFAKGAAGKDRVAYNAKPVEKLGKEFITNGGFDTDSGWTFTSGGGVAITDGKAVFSGASGNQDLYRDTPVLSGRTVKISFTISDYEAGTIEPFFHMSSPDPGGDAVSGNGSFSFIKEVSPGHNDNTGVRARSNFKGKIDNFSVKEVIERPRDFQFSRGAALTATRIGPDGLIKKGRENLLLYSNKFDETSAWTTTSGAEWTGGQAGYDGKNNAWKFSSGTASAANAYQTFTTYPSGVQTFSFFAKAGNNDGFVIRVDPSDNSPTHFEFYADLSDGTFANSSAGPQAYPRIFNQITDVGDGWYRLQLTFDEPIDTVMFVLANISASPLTTSVGTGQYVYIQDAQLENSIVPTETIETFGSTVEAGLQEREPRFNYHDYANDGYPALLMEEARTNLFPYSEGPHTRFSVTSGVTAALSQTEVGPDGRIGSTIALGNMTAAAGDRFGFGGDIEASHRGEDFTGSIYVKGTSGETFTYQIKRNPASDGEGNDYGWSASDKEQHTFNGKWQRISATFTSLADTQRAKFYFSRTSDSVDAAYQDTADEFFVYGGVESESKLGV